MGVDGVKSILSYSTRKKTVNRRCVRHENCVLFGWCFQCGVSSYIENGGGEDRGGQVLK